MSKLSPSQREIARQLDKAQRRKEKAVADLLSAYGYDINSEALRETPARVARMFDELWSGRLLTNEQIAQKYGKCFPCNSDHMVIERDILCFSTCEHHLALMYDIRISIAYIPHGKVLGLSKLARIAETVCHRLQLQERIGEDIAQCVTIATGSPDVAVFIRGKHGCMTARGIKKPEADTVTSTLYGRFKEDAALRAEFIALAK